MAFQIFVATPSSAVATGGTIAFTIPSDQVGQYKYEGGHILFAEGLSASFSFPTQFTISWSASTATVTYNGTTTIPAGTIVKLQLQTAGETNYLTTTYPPADSINWIAPVVGAGVKVPRATLAREYRVLIGSPITLSTTAILATTAVAATTVQTFTTPYSMDVPRSWSMVSSSAGDTTQTITVRGFDELGNALTETQTLNGTTGVNGKKAFAQIVSYQASATLAGNLSIGITNVLGLPLFLPGGTGAGSGYVIKEVMDGTAPTAGTFVGGDLTYNPTTLVGSENGDVRGTYTPNTACNGTHVYELLMYGSDLTFKGVPQCTF